MEAGSRPIPARVRSPKRQLQYPLRPLLLKRGRAVDVQDFDQRLVVGDCPVGVLGEVLPAKRVDGPGDGAFGVAAHHLGRFIAGDHERPGDGDGESRRQRAAEFIGPLVESRAVPRRFIGCVAGPLPEWQ